MARAKKAAASGRGSPEAVAKRKAARALNSIFDNRGPAAAGIDGRSARRRERLLKELKEGRNGQPLKALDALAAISELLKLGETPASIRKLKPKLPPAPEPNETNTAAYREAQQLYGFDLRAWKVLGVEFDQAGGEDDSGRKAAKKRGRPAKKAAG